MGSKREQFRQMTPNELAKCPGNVVVAQVDEDVSFLMHLCEEYEPIRIYLLRQHYVRNNEQSLVEYYGNYYSSIREGLRAGTFSDTEVVTVDVPRPYDFTFLVSSLNNILEKEKTECTKVYVSIMGTPVFAAAAATVVPMFRNALLSTHMGHVQNCHLRLKANTYDGVLCGPSKEPGFQNNLYYVPRVPVDRNLLKAFKLYFSIGSEYRTNANVVRTLMYNGLWRLWTKDSEYRPSTELNSFRYSGTSVEKENVGSLTEWLSDPHMLDGEDAAGYAAMQKTETMQLSRNYLSKWYELDWLGTYSKGMRRTRSRQKIRSTGMNFIHMFCSDEVYPVTPDMICPNGAFTDYSLERPDRDDNLEEGE